MSWKARSAFTFIRTKPGTAEAVWKRFQQDKAAIGSWVITGDWDVLGWTDAKSWDEVYKKAAEIRQWEGVVGTSSHFVYEGVKNGKWWWQWPAGAWVQLRDAKLNGNFKKLTEWDWVASSVSVPGQWDYITWVAGNTWDEVWENVWTLNKAGWQTSTAVPVRSWWNRAWEKSWWK